MQNIDIQNTIDTPIEKDMYALQEFSNDRTLFLEAAYQCFQENENITQFTTLLDKQLLA